MIENQKLAAPQAIDDNFGGLDVMFEENFKDSNVRQRWELSDGCQLTISNEQAQLKGPGVMIASASCGWEYKVEATGDYPQVNS